MAARQKEPLKDGDLSLSSDSHCQVSTPSHNASIAPARGHTQTSASDDRDNASENKTTEIQRARGTKNSRESESTVSDTNSSDLKSLDENDRTGNVDINTEKAKDMICDEDTKNHSANDVIENVTPQQRTVDGPEVANIMEDQILTDDEEGEWIDVSNNGDSGEESDIEDNDEVIYPIKRRLSNPELPDTVTCLHTASGCTVYVIGTAHFSLESQEDVAKTIEATQPDVIVLELCSSRVNILQLDEKTLLEEAKNITLEKLRATIKQSGLMQGVMHVLFLNMSAHVTKQLGMAPGGEFRRAFREGQKVPGCRLHLGDRPIQITLRRALSSLSWWQHLRLCWYLLTSKEPISKEDVEKCKQKDLLEQMLKEMTGEFPALSQVFVDERDLFLSHSLKVATRPFQSRHSPTGFIEPKVVVGVVGIGHVPGIKNNWDQNINIEEIMKIPPRSAVGKILKWGIKASLVGILIMGCYRVYRFATPLIF